MSEFKGTKTEWRVSGTEKTFVYALNEKSSNAFSLNINNDGKTDIKEQQANALLISKAPEMLEMLEKINTFYKDKAIFEDEFKLKNEIEQLIKEATEL